tara:strand:+ start:807 stop:1160 length:354 start_codon:yes stop_codon:yes gene_type:complete
MLDIIISIILYALFGFIGIYGLTKILFFKKHFQNKQNAIYLTIYYIVFGFFIGQNDPENTGVAFQIGYGLGNCFVAILGAAIASYFANKQRFLINKVFYMSLFGSVAFGSLLLLTTI